MEYLQPQFTMTDPETGYLSNHDMAAATLQKLDDFPVNRTRFLQRDPVSRVFQTSDHQTGHFFLAKRTCTMFSLLLSGAHPFHVLDCSSVGIVLALIALSGKKR
jgi:hypothetical protein